MHPDQSLEKKTVPQPFDVAASYAMQLSLMEVGLGSILHAFHFPFSGFFLSLNQCFVLNRAVLFSISSDSSAGRFIPMTVSNTAAIIKTLSPYGKKFTPMLAISMQGLLFNMGVLFFGKNLFGRCIGSLLLSVWPMIQPIIVYGIIYGSIVFDMTAYYNQMMSKLPWLDGVNLKVIAFGYIVMHLSLTLGVCLLTQLLPARMLERYDRYIMASVKVPLGVPKKNTILQKLRGVRKDFTSPFFLFSLILSGFFFYATLHSLGAFFLAFFRLIAIAFLTFFILRNISSEKCINFISNSSLLKRYTPYVEEVLLRIQKQTGLKR
jgi:hypothetical protein